MKVAVTSGQIQNGSVYEVTGTGSITYNSIVYNVGQTFTGTTIATFTTSGSPVVYQVIVIQEVAVELNIRGSDIVYPERVKIQGASIEKTVTNTFSDSVKVQGVTIEFESYASGQIIWIN
jgi:hypothetical protein